MATSNKIEHAWTSQDVKALDCAMISKLGIDINSIDGDDILGLEARLGEIHFQNLQYRSQRNHY